MSGTRLTAVDYAQVGAYGRSEKLGARPQPWAMPEQPSQAEKPSPRQTGGGREGGSAADQRQPFPRPAPPPAESRPSSAFLAQSLAQGAAEPTSAAPSRLQAAVRAYAKTVGAAAPEPPGAAHIVAPMAQLASGRALDLTV